MKCRKQPIHVDVGLELHLIIPDYFIRLARTLCATTCVGLDPSAFPGNRLNKEQCPFLRVVDVILLSGYLLFCSDE